MCVWCPSVLERVKNKRITKQSFKVIIITPASTVFMKKLTDSKSRDKICRYFPEEIWVVKVNEKIKGSNSKVKGSFDI